MRDDRGMDRADLGRFLTTEPKRHDVDGCDDPDCMACDNATEGPYTVEIDSPGCGHCAAGRTYYVVFRNDQPGELAESTSWEDYDHACDIRDMMNSAYQAGLNATNTGGAISVYDQCVITANALINLAASPPMLTDMRRIVREHADDLRRSAGLLRP